MELIIVFVMKIYGISTKFLLNHAFRKEHFQNSKPYTQVLNLIL